MTYTPIAKGTTSWDVPVNAAFIDQDERITENAADIAALENPQTQNGVLAWNYDPVMSSGSTTPGSNGVLYMFKMRNKVPGIATNIVLGFQTGGSGFTVGQNFAGLYNSAGTLLSGTPDQSTNWANVGKIMCPLSSPVSLGSDTYYVGVLLNATTRPSMLRTVSLSGVADLVNLNQSANQYNFSTFGTSLTALPSSVDMSARVSTFAAWWAALS